MGKVKVLLTLEVEIDVVSPANAAPYAVQRAQAAAATLDRWRQHPAVVGVDRENLEYVVKLLRTARVDASCEVVDA